MPIEKVPVVHRFGIISHNQRLELQERLLKKAVEIATANTDGKGVRYVFVIGQHDNPSYEANGV